VRHSPPLLLAGVIAASAVTASSGGGFVRTWGGALRDGAESLVVDAATNIYVGGRFDGTVDFNPDGPNHTNLTSNGGGADAFLCKFNPTGTLLWVRAWGSNGLDRITSVGIDASNNIYAVGEFQNTVDFNPAGPNHSNLISTTPGMNEAFLCKYSSNGDFQWAKPWGGSRGDEAYNVAVDAEGNSYTVGDSCSPTIDFDPLGVHAGYTNYEGTSPLYFDAFLCKYDRDGNLVWWRAWGGNGYDDCCAVTLDGLGNLFVGGMFGSTNDTCDFNADTNVPHVAARLNSHGPHPNVLDSFLCKYDTDGNFKWARSWGSTNDDPGQALAPDGQGGVYMSGYFGSWMFHDGVPRDTVDFNPLGTPSNVTSHGGCDIYFCRFGSTGNLMWVEGWGGTNDDAPAAMAVDRWGYVYLPGYFQGTVDFDPGPGVSNLTAVGLKDVCLSKLDADGHFVLARSCGGVFDDFVSRAIVDGSGYAYLAGSFQKTNNFGALWGGSTNRIAVGTNDAYLVRLPTCAKITVIKTGNGSSSVGTGSPAAQIVSLNIATQIVYTGGDWYRIASLATNGAAADAAAGTRVFTQALVNVAADVSNDVTFTLATTNQTGYPDVPTAWLTNWAEDAVISDAAFDVHAKYLIGLDPTTSNTFSLAFESVGVSGGSVTTVLRRTCTGGLSPDGMHGQLELQATDELGSPFTNVAGTAVTGANVFDGTGRRIVTNTVEGASRFVGAVIR
jgi:hypothetical protein